jgi:hypothetical protein
MKIKHYIIEATNMDPMVIRGTAKKVQTVVRSLHQSGSKATMRCLHNATERNAAILAAA